MPSASALPGIRRPASGWPHSMPGWRRTPSPASERSCRGSTPCSPSLQARGGCAARGVRVGMEGAVAPAPPPTRAPVELPVRFGGEEGPDLADLAARTGTDPAGLVEVLTTSALRVALIGHLPGLPYLTGLPAALDVPRRTTPRTAVPQGSVGVAARMVCVYPARGPGGWHIVGRTVARLVDPERTPPFLLAAGDAVQL